MTKRRSTVSSQSADRYAQYPQSEPSVLCCGSTCVQQRESRRVKVHQAFSWADPLSPFATVHQATLLAHKGELDPAAELFRQAVKNVSCTYTTDALINFYAKYEKFDDAIAVLDGMDEDDKKAAKYLTVRSDVRCQKEMLRTLRLRYDKALGFAASTQWRFLVRHSSK